MATLVRLNPIAREALAWHRAMDRLSADPFVRFARLNRPARPISPRPNTLAIDMYENEDKVVVEAALPGFEANQLDISIEDGQLTIQGEVKHETEEENGNGHNYHVRERFQGSFRRIVSLPTEVDADAAEAKLENGVLTLTLPKAEAVKPRQIPVKVS